MTLQIAQLLVILVITLVLFSFEWVSADVVALGVLLTLTLTGLLPLDLAFSGFGSDTVIMILGLLILTAALERTGVVELTARAILNRTSKDPKRMLLMVMVGGALMSSFMSNTAATAFFVPIVMGMTRRAKISPSKVLMPLAFSSILASSVTLVSTSTNLVVSGLMSSFDLSPIRMFELTPVGVPIAIAGLGYMYFIGRRIIPERVSADELTEEFGLNPFLSEILVPPDSPLSGKTLSESGLGEELDLTVLRIARGKRKFLEPKADLTVRAGDILLVEGSRDSILKVKDTAGIDIRAEVKFSDPDLETDEMRLGEAIITPRSPLIGRTLKGINFRERYGLQVLAINQSGETIHQKLSRVKLRLGDLLLLQGKDANFKALGRDQVARVIGTVEDRRRVQPLRARISVIAFLGSLALAAFNLVTLPVAVLLGVMVVFLARCITPEEAYRAVEWRAIILIGSMLAFGSAMVHTGTAEYLARLISDFSGQADPIWLLSGFFLLTVLLTQPMSNQAAAVVVLPVALQTALRLDLNPRTFAIMIAVAASTSYLTPLEPSCLMVYGIGRYRFIDFLKVGSLLTLFVFLIAILLVPRIWPLVR